MATIQRFGRVEGIYFGSILLLAFVGFLSPASYNALPAGPILEGVMAVCALLVMRVPKREAMPFLAVSAAYVTISLSLMVFYKPSNYLDFAQAYKAFIYIIPLCFFYRRDLFDRRQALFVLKLLMVAFLLKYSYSIALNVTPRMGTRPGLFVENNFELIFLLLYFFILREDFGKRLTAWFAVLSVIVLISGSRSSALALIVVFCGIYLRNLSLKTVFYLLGLAILGASAAALFLSRGYAAGGIESIDRFRFMMIFLYEIRNWSVFDFLFGSFPITALSNESCKALSFYEGLFSYSEDGSCYSVVLHSYFFRVIFDHGVFGLALLFYFLAFTLKRSGYARIDVAVIIGVLAASALSVSAMNSIFATLALALAFGIKRLDSLST
ncbi:hypothetical protein [uncultured Stenotrophomonas sp.]|uniref:hypothetical protein n=1 Tax=uncultured Stenotrophomonas sp. TaxID=165438 RepID=UPI0025F725C8|nr:hypothetical protein [uncultured Stenotrophomonas sp.]